ncbi:hypothetical protein [Eremococcus coleocola]|uniref:hypothetical protein n=1 Tax=Eremococcus coleocola TaxID=88132 RepID=UPI0003F5B856|nr:hypothetical protein [Eremococcus coleocola]
MIDNEWLEFIQGPYELLLEGTKRLERMMLLVDKENNKAIEAITIRINEFEEALKTLEEVG